MRLLPVLFFLAALALAAPATAQPRDEAPDATPAGPTTSSAAEELTSKTTEEKPVEKKPEPKKEKKAAKKEKKPTPKPAKKPEVAKEEPKPKEPEAKKTAPVVSSGPGASSRKDPVIVINPCSGDVSAELVAPQPKAKSIQPGKDIKCLTERQCDALCRVGESFGEGGGSPRLSPRGDIVFASDAFTDFDDCVKACGPKCE